MSVLPESLMDRKTYAAQRMVPRYERDNDADAMRRAHAALRHDLGNAIVEKLIPGQQYLVEFEIDCREPLGDAYLYMMESQGPPMFDGTVLCATLHVQPVRYQYWNPVMNRCEDMAIPELARTALQEIKHRVKRLFRRKSP